MANVSFVTPEMVQNAYDTVTICLGTFYPAQYAYEDFKADLEALAAKALYIDNVIEGKNVAERSARSREKFVDEYADLDTLKARANAAKLALDLANIEKSRVNALLRLAEITVQAEANEHPAE